MDFSSEAVRGLAEAGASSPSCSVTYGPNRPAFATMVRPVAGSVPRILSPVGRDSSSAGALRGQLVRRGALGDVGPLAVALQVRAVPADPDHDVGAGQRERADGPGVDVAQVADQLLEPFLAVGAEVEPAQPRDPLRLATGDLVERLLHLRGEVVVDQVLEVLLQQRDHGEGQERGDQRGALLEHVAAVQDRAHDRGVGGRPADRPVLQLLDQRGLGVAGRRAGGVLGRGQALRDQRLGLGQRRQRAAGCRPARRWGRPRPPRRPS